MLLEVVALAGNVGRDFHAGVSRTRATLRSAEFGFGGGRLQRVHTPRRWGEPRSAGVLVLARLVVPARCGPAAGSWAHVLLRFSCGEPLTVRDRSGGFGSRTSAGAEKHGIWPAHRGRRPRTASGSPPSLPLASGAFESHVSRERPSRVGPRLRVPAPRPEPRGEERRAEAGAGPRDRRIRSHAVRCHGLADGIVPSAPPTLDFDEVRAQQAVERAPRGRRRTERAPAASSSVSPGSSDFRCASAGVPTAFVDMSCNTEAVQPGLEPGQRDRGRRRSSRPIRSTSSRDPTTTSIASTTPLARGRRSWQRGSSRRSTEVRPGSTGRSRCTRATARVILRRPSTRRHGVALMAQIDNLGCPLAASTWPKGDVSVSRSQRRRPDLERAGHRVQGQGHGHRPGEHRGVLRQGVADGRQQPGLAVLRPRLPDDLSVPETGLQGAYAESPIFLSWSDDGGRTWSRPPRSPGSHPERDVPVGRRRGDRLF